MMNIAVHNRAAFHWPVSQRWIFAGATLVLLPGLSLLFSFNPASSIFFPPCPFHALTGLHCPGCGTLRALHQLLNGHLLRAFGLNPLMVLSLPFVGYAFLSNAMTMVNGRRLPTVFIPAIWIWMLLGAVITFWALRNIPVYPFSLLAP